MASIFNVTMEEINSFKFKIERETIKTPSFPKLVFSFNERGAQKLLAGIPQAVKLLVLTCARFSDKTRSLEKMLSKLGFFYYTVTLKEGIFALESLNDFAMQEGTRAILAVGGEEEICAAKLIAKLFSKPVYAICLTPNILFPLSDYTFYSAKNIVYLSKCNQPVSAIVDKNYFLVSGDILPQTFAVLASKIVSLFDWYFFSLVMGHLAVKNSLDALVGVYTTLLNALEGGVKGSSEVVDSLIDCQLRVLTVCDNLAASRLFVGGDTQVGAAITSLYLVDKYEQKSFDENCFLAGKNVFILYGNYLFKGVENRLVLPPNPIKRAEYFQEYYCLDEVAASKIVQKVSDTSLVVYRFNEYRDDLWTFYNELKKLLARSEKIFKRLYRDDGFSLKNYGARLDFETSLALAPDLLKSATMLSFLEKLGVLDEFLF